MIFLNYVIVKKSTNKFENSLLKNGTLEFWSEALIVSILSYFVKSLKIGLFWNNKVALFKIWNPDSLRVNFGNFLHSLQSILEYFLFWYIFLDFNFLANNALKKTYLHVQIVYHPLVVPATFAHPKIYLLSSPTVIQSLSSHRRFVQKLTSSSKLTKFQNLPMECIRTMCVTHSDIYQSCKNMQMARRRPFIAFRTLLDRFKLQS